MTSHLCCIFGFRPSGGGEGLASAAVLSTVVCIIAFNIIFKNNVYTACKVQLVCSA